MEMHIEIHMPTESLDESHGSRFEISYFVLRVFFVKAKLHGFLDGSCNDGVCEAQDFSLKPRIPGAHVAKWDRHGEDPLANDGAGGKDVVGEVRSSFRHPPCPATSAKAALFATEGDKPFMFAVNAAEAQESVREHAAFEEGLELFGDM